MWREIPTLGAVNNPFFTGRIMVTPSAGPNATLRPNQDLLPDLSMTDYIQVFTTAPTKQAADSIAETLLREKLAACVQISGPIESGYWWQGKLETAAEWQCVVKSRLGLYTQLEEAIRRVHPYEVPEILVTRVETGSPAYLDWLQNELARPSSD
jgi:periplasmic divalent cation tolerance protein